MGITTEQDTKEQALLIESHERAQAEWAESGFTGPPMWVNVRAMELYEQASFANLIPHERNIVFANPPIKNLTSTIQVVAPAPNVMDGIHKLDPSLFTILINKACELPIPFAHLWMVQDETATETEWFYNGLKTCADIACFDPQYIGKLYPDTPYLFQSGGLLGSPVMYQKGADDGEKIEYEPIEPPVRLYHGFVRGNATSPCMAMQLAWMLGATEVRLCGVQLQGTTYFDGSDTGTDLRKDPEYGYWDTVIRRFNGAVRCLESKGVKVVSLTDTALDVVVI